ncbi:50S ribosomal protein L23 [Candidatus Tisiphia endosymbiont of Nedyus quadrimaculatus]|uniref:50S ribosomal protein L23 n=1 Tax=Candidatus Tisiphia endosymbiont of Nedyus quadrimaculatus TaxID=3139332 RepID=UPI00345E954C
MKSYKHYDLIRNPVITEKSNILSEQQNKFTFHVADSAEKVSIKMAVEKIFQVKVKKVNIMNVKGKRKRFKGVNGRQSDKKKAIVTLEKDYTIDFTGGIK